MRSMYSCSHLKLSRSIEIMSTSIILRRYDDIAKQKILIICMLKFRMVSHEKKG